MGNAALGFLNSRTKVVGGEMAEKLHTPDLIILYRLNSFEEPIGFHAGAGLTLAWADVQGGVAGTGPFVGSGVPLNVHLEMDYSPGGVFALYAAGVPRFVVFKCLLLPPPSIRSQSPPRCSRTRCCGWERGFGCSKPRPATLTDAAVL